MRYAKRKNKDDIVVRCDRCLSRVHGLYKMIASIALFKYITLRLVAKARCWEITREKTISPYS